MIICENIFWIALSSKRLELESRIFQAAKVGRQPSKMVSSPRFAALEKPVKPSFHGIASPYVGSWQSGSSWITADEVS